MLLLMDLLGFRDYPSSSSSSWRSISDEEIAYGTPLWWIYAGISAALVLFAGIMSGLTLGLMSLGLMDLEVLQQSGTEEEKKQAATILPVVKEQHQLLVTLLLCNAAAMEALPIFLDTMFNEVVAVILSVTFVLAFGEVIPQALCSRHGLAIGANLVWLVKILMVLCFPISYPVGKVSNSLPCNHACIGESSWKTHG
jgi:metal transporter CNNM